MILKRNVPGSERALHRLRHRPAGRGRDDAFVRLAVMGGRAGWRRGIAGLGAGRLLPAAPCANAEDAVQAALWQLHRRIGTLRVIAAFASWLFRIVERERRRLLALQRRTVPLEHAEPSALRIEPVPSDLRRDLGA